MKKENMKLLLPTGEYELLDYLYQAFPQVNKKKIKSLLVHGNVFVNDRNTTKYNFKIHTGDKVKIIYGKMVPLKKGKVLPILYEDDTFIAIDKPAGLLSVATEKETVHTAYHMVREHVKKTNPKEKVFILHRLDKDTSGVLLFVKNERVKEQLQKCWNESVTREYIAITENTGLKKEGTITSYIKETNTHQTVLTHNKKEGKKAVTHYQVIGEKNGFSTLRIFLDTGRKNQIRIGLASIGHPIIGDKKFGSLKNPIGRLGLHAYQLIVEHPMTHKKYKFTSRVPESFHKFMTKE